MKRLRATAAHSKRSPSPAHASIAIPLGNAKVVVYGASWCGYCQAAKEYFDRRGIPHEDKDIETDAHARLEVAGKCARAGSPFDGTIPVLDVNGHIIHGFDVDGIEQALRSEEGQVIRAGKRTLQKDNGNNHVEKGNGIFGLKKAVCR